MHLLQCYNTVLAIFFETVCISHSIANWCRNRLRQFYSLSVSLGKFKVKFYLAVSAVHIMHFWYLVYRLFWFLPGEYADVRITKAAFLEAKWRDERDFANEWYMLAVFLATGAIAHMYDEVERSREEVRKLKKQLEEKTD